MTWSAHLPRLALAAVMTLAAAGPGWATDRPPAALYQRWLQANEDCRGGSGDSPVTMTACEYRNTIDRKMAAVGWCDGARGSYYLDWHRCRR